MGQTPALAAGCLLCAERCRLFLLVPPSHPTIDARKSKATRGLMTSVCDLLTGYGYKSYVLCRALAVVGCGRGLPRRFGGGSAAAVTLGCALAFAVLTVGGTARAGDETRAVHMRLGTHEAARGRADAPITIIEFTDYQCPYCRRFQAEAWPRLKRKYVDSGKVRFIVRDMPLEFHSAARPAAEVAHCAAEQGKFWPMHEALLRNSTQLNDTYVIELAREMGLDVLRLRACAMEDRYEGAIARNAAEAAALGIHGTPTFVIGRAAEGELDGVRVAGALPYEQFAAYLDQLLPGR